MNKKSLSDFELDFRIMILKLGLTKKEISNHLDITIPTLNYKIKNPKKLNIGQMQKLEELGFKIAPYIN